MPKGKKLGRLLDKLLPESDREIILFLIIMGTICLGVSAFFDAEIDKINNQIYAHERNVLFDTNRVLIGGIFYYLDNETFSDYSNITFHVGSLGRDMNYIEAVEYLISKEINFRDDLINVEVFYPQRNKLINKKLGWFWIGMLSLVFAAILSWGFIKKREK